MSISNYHRKLNEPLLIVESDESSDDSSTIQDINISSKSSIVKKERKKHNSINKVKNYSYSSILLQAQQLNERSNSTTPTVVGGGDENGPMRAWLNKCISFHDHPGMISDANLCSAYQCLTEYGDPSPSFSARTSPSSLDAVNSRAAAVAALVSESVKSAIEPGSSSSNSAASSSSSASCTNIKNSRNCNELPTRSRTPSTIGSVSLRSSSNALTAHCRSNEVYQMKAMEGNPPLTSAEAAAVAADTRRRRRLATSAAACFFWRFRSVLRLRTAESSTLISTVLALTLLLISLLYVLPVLNQHRTRRLHPTTSKSRLDVGTPSASFPQPFFLPRSDSADGGPLDRNSVEEDSNDSNEALLSVSWTRRDAPRAATEAAGAVGTVKIQNSRITKPSLIMTQTQRELRTEILRGEINKSFIANKALRENNSVDKNEKNRMNNDLVEGEKGVRAAVTTIKTKLNRKLTSFGEEERSKYGKILIVTLLIIYILFSYLWETRTFLFLCHPGVVCIIIGFGFGWILKIQNIYGNSGKSLKKLNIKIILLFE